MRLQTIRLTIASCVIVALIGGAARSQDSSKSTATGNLMQTLFSPVIAAEPKAMAVLQRTSLLSEAVRARELQLAFVVDGTESMSSELASIRTRLLGMVQQLSEMLSNRVSIQLVIYRDVGADQLLEIPISVSNNEFTNDVNAIQSGLDKLVPKSGAPYFLEPVDVGLHAALTQLHWSESPEVARWILLVGDAPPFQNGFEEPNGAARKFSEDQLILMAKDKGITIHTLLCPTRPEDQDSYNAVLPEAKSFFGNLAVSTGGICFDLSDKKFQDELQAAAKRASVEYLTIEPISQEDIDRAIASIVKVPEAKSTQAPKVAVLPFMPKHSRELAKRDNPYFDAARNKTVMLTQFIEDQIDKIGGQKVRRVDVERKTLDAVREGAADDQLVKRIGDALRADFVLCVFKEALENKRFQYDYALMETATGKYVVAPESKTGDLGKPSEAADAILKSIASKTKTLPPPSDLKTLMARVTPKPPGIRNVSIGNSTEMEELIGRARRTMDDLVGIEFIQSNEAEGQQQRIREILNSAEETVAKALKLEPENPNANSIAANIRIARLLSEATNAAERNNWYEQAKSYLTTASKNFAKELVGERAEAEADLFLMKAQNKEAASKYLSVVKVSDSLDAKLRARWMLMGLYSGDWETGKVSPELVDPVKAREIAIQILAFHPNSPHAARLRQVLQMSTSSTISSANALPSNAHPAFAQ